MSSVLDAIHSSSVDPCMRALYTASSATSTSIIQSALLQHGNEKQLFSAIKSVAEKLGLALGAPNAVSDGHLLPTGVSTTDFLALLYILDKAIAGHVQWCELQLEAKAQQN